MIFIYEYRNVSSFALLVWKSSLTSLRGSAPFPTGPAPHQPWTGDAVRSLELEAKLTSSDSTLSMYSSKNHMGYGKPDLHYTSEMAKVE